MISLQAIRRRLPLWAFILLAVLCLIMVGIACACATGHPAQKVDQALEAAQVAAEPLIEIWTFAFAALVMLIAVEVRRRRVDETSPAVLQCFLF